MAALAIDGTVALTARASVDLAHFQDKWKNGLPQKVQLIKNVL